MSVKLKPTMEEVHLKILVAQKDPTKKTNAIDAIKAFGIDEFFCMYDRYLDQDYTQADAGPLYIFAAKLYHGSKQHWRRRT